MISLAGCRPGDAETGDGALSGALMVAENPDNPFSALASVRVDADASVRVRYGEGELDHETPAFEAEAGVPLVVPVLQLRAGRSFQLQAVATASDEVWTSEQVTYETGPLPDGWPTCVVASSAPDDAWTEDEAFCTNGLLADGTYMYWCADRWGEPVHMVRTADDDSLMSMAPVDDETWMSTSTSTSKLAIFNLASEQTSERSMLYFTDRTRFEHEYIDGHAIYPIRAGAYAGDVAFITDVTEVLDDGSTRIGNGIIFWDPDSGAVDYDYSFHGALGDGEPMDPLLPYDRDALGGGGDDWTHLNAMVRGADADGREYFLLSLRNQAWIVKFYPDEDAIAWRLGREGDFVLVDDLDAAAPVEQSPLGWMAHQHGLQIVAREGARLSLFTFDNGNHRYDKSGLRDDLAYSRAIRIDLDQDTMRATIGWSYGSEDAEAPDHLYSNLCGNATLMSDGASILVNEATAGSVRELSYPGGEERWRLTCDQVDVCWYRVSAFPSLYETSGEIE